jgi:hypothetical protein
MSLKQKNIILLIGFILLFWLCYQFPISQMKTAKKEYQKLQIEHELFSKTPQKIRNFHQENSYLDSILSKYQFSSEKTFQSNLLQTITSFSNKNNLSVVSFNEPHIITKNKVAINTFSFSVKGSYNNSLGLIHELEQTKRLGKIVSVKFEKKKNYRTNRGVLVTEVLLQRIEE